MFLPILVATCYEIPTRNEGLNTGTQNEGTSKDPDYTSSWSIREHWGYPKSHKRDKKTATTPYDGIIT
jgi:hypothetical protein